MKQPNFRAKLLCAIFGHEWHYRLSEYPVVLLNGWPPCTRCKRCNEPHPNPIATELEGHD